MRRTPEKNWAIRASGHFGPNGHLRQETLEGDFRQGDNRFSQGVIGEAAHTYEIGGQPISHYIAEAIHNRFGIELPDGDNEGVGKPFDILPRLGLHSKPVQDSYSLKDLRTGTFKHYKNQKEWTRSILVCQWRMFYSLQVMTLKHESRFLITLYTEK